MNVLLRGQSNAVILGELTGLNSVAAQVQRLLGFDGVTDTVTLRFSWQDPAGRNTATGGTALIGDWLQPVTGAGSTTWQAKALEQGLINYIDALPTATKAEPTVVLWLHNEYDSDGARQPLLTSTWESAVRFDASLVRAAFGTAVPYVFVEPIPYVSGTDAGAQAIRVGMEELTADAAFNARLTAQNDDLAMNADVFGAGGHMNQQDAALVAGRAARSIAEVFAQYAKPGSAAASGNLDDTGPIAIQAVQTAARQVAVTVKFDAAAALQALDADAATGIGWSAISGSTVLKATGVALTGANTLSVSFGSDLPAGATLYYGYGNAQLAGAGGSVQGNAIYDDQGLPMRTPAKGLLIGAAAVQPGSTVAGTDQPDTLQAGANGDTLIGGKGNDFLIAGAGADSFTFSLGDGQDWIQGFTPGVDRIRFNAGIAGGDIVLTSMTLEGVAGLGVIYGKGGDGLFLAGVSALQPGDIVLTPPPAAPSSVQFGGAGDDTLAGQGSGDTLVGGRGNDYLVGGAGADVFGLQPGDGPDWIENFTPGTDKLLLGGGLTAANVTTFLGDLLGVQGLYVQYGAGNDVAFLARVTALQANDITFGSLPQPTTPPVFTVVTAAGTAQVAAQAYAGPLAGLQYQFTGTATAETVTGTPGNDYIDLGRGNDGAVGGAGNDRIDGGAGLDIAVFTGARADYTVTMSNNVYTVTDRVGGRDGTDTLFGVERIRFADGEMSVEQAGGIDGVVHRFYNERVGVHFYTASNAEADTVRATLPDYNDEGLSFRIAPGNAAGAVDIYRFFFPSGGFHFYTASATERDFVINNLPAYQYEGVAYQAYGSDAGPQEELYRFFNTTTGAHFYTTSETERDSVVANLPGFSYEGIAYYVDPL
nr:hypothetical protein [Paracraurococcus ruber]